MPEQPELKENTPLADKYFPFNIFHNTPDSWNILSTHWHDNIEILYMLEGSAVFYIGSESYSASPGDLLFVNKGLLHSGYSVGNTRVGYYAIVFHPSLLSSQSPDPAHTRYVTPYALGQAPFPERLEPSGPGYAEVRQLLDSIVREFNEKNPAYEIAIKAYLHLLVTLLLRLFPGTGRHTPGRLPSERHMDRFRNLISYVEEHYFEKITIQQASGIVNMNSYHFCKTFKKITGRTFIEFLNLHRVNQAEELLRSTNLPVSLVAEKVGFCNINYFDRLFKQYKRYSPSKCRK